MKPMLPIPAGAFFMVTSGVYSDFGVAGVFRAKREIATSALLEEYLTINPKQRERYQFMESEFLCWLDAQGICEQIDTWEFYLGEYDLSTVGVQPAKRGGRQ